MTNQIIQGDCLELMKLIPDKSIDAIISDPPYGTNLMEFKKEGFGGVSRAYKCSLCGKEWSVHYPRVK
jgi:DNA modification methylase